jgi:glycosyltransferase involved in cell wall biosynthesis
MNKEIIFSIIIPHKNTPKLLRRCLESIPRRDDIQIIIIDDNSNKDIDEFNGVINFFKESIEVYIKKEGKGAGYARNVGLNHAKGKWLLFADADDFFTKDGFDYLFAEINSPQEIIYFKVISCYSDTYEPAKRDKTINQLVDDFIDGKKDAENWIRYKYSVPWGKMIKRELVCRENILFEEVLAANDGMFGLFTGYFAHSVNSINHVIYCATVNRGSLTNSYSVDILRSRYLVSLRYNKFLREHNCKKYQTVVVMYLLLNSIRYGFRTFFHFVQFAIHYKMNPLFGVHKWLSRYLLYH